MPRKKDVKPEVETREVEGHEIEYRRVGDREEVRIDGELMPFFRVGDSYQLEANAYAPEKPTLLDAAEAFAKTIPPRTS